MRGSWEWTFFKHQHLPLGFPFSATNCVFHCHASTGCLLLRLLTWCGIRLFHSDFCHFFVLGCCVFRSTNFTDKNGSRKVPFSASNFDNSCRLLRHPLCLFNSQVLSLFHMALPSNCVIRCVTWLHSCFVSGLSPLDRGFHHMCSHLSVDCGGSIPPMSFGVGSPLLSPSTVFTVHCA